MATVATADTTMQPKGTDMVVTGTAMKFAMGSVKVYCVEDGRNYDENYK